MAFDALILTTTGFLQQKEPCFNQALEEQAVGRVHRLGQRNEVKIFRMITENSIDEKILKARELMGFSSGKGGAGSISSDAGSQILELKNKIKYFDALFLS